MGAEMLRREPSRSVEDTEIIKVFHLQLRSVKFMRLWAEMGQENRPC